MMAKKIQDCFWQSVIMAGRRRTLKESKVEIKSFSLEQTGRESMVQWIKEIKIVTKLIPNEKMRMYYVSTKWIKANGSNNNNKKKLNEQNSLFFIPLFSLSVSPCLLGLDALFLCVLVYVGFIFEVVTFLYVNCMCSSLNDTTNALKTATKNHRNLLRPFRNQFAITQNKVADILSLFFSLLFAFVLFVRWLNVLCATFTARLSFLTFSN